MMERRWCWGNYPLDLYFFVNMFVSISESCTILRDHVSVSTDLDVLREYLRSVRAICKRCAAECSCTPYSKRYGGTNTIAELESSGQAVLKCENAIGSFVKGVPKLRVSIYKSKTHSSSLGGEFVASTWWRVSVKSRFGMYLCKD